MPKDRKDSSAKPSASTGVSENKNPANDIPDLNDRMAFYAFQGAMRPNITSPILNDSDLIDDNLAIFRINSTESRAGKNKIISPGKAYYGYTLTEMKEIPIEKCAETFGSLTPILTNLFGSGTSMGFSLDSTKEEALKTAKDEYTAKTSKEDTTSKTEDNNSGGATIKYCYVKIPFIHGKTMPDMSKLTDSDQESVAKLHTIAIFDDSIYNNSTAIEKNKLVKIEFLDENINFAKIVGVLAQGGTPAAAPSFFGFPDAILAFAQAQVQASVSTLSGPQAMNGILFGHSTTAQVYGIFNSLGGMPADKKLFYKQESGGDQKSYTPGFTSRPGTAETYLINCMSAIKDGSAGAEIIDWVNKSFYVFIMVGTNSAYKGDARALASALVDTLGTERFYVFARGSYGWGSKYVASNVRGRDFEFETTGIQGQYYDKMLSGMYAKGAKNCIVLRPAPWAASSAAAHSRLPEYEEEAKMMLYILTGGKAGIPPIGSGNGGYINGKR